MRGNSHEPFLGGLGTATCPGYPAQSEKERLTTPLNVLSRSKRHRNLAGCLLHYDLNEPLPDHSSLTRIRERYGVDIFRRFFDAIVEQCQQEKLIWGRELYIDSTQVNANADLDSLTPRFAVEARAAIQTHLAALFSDEESQQEQQTAATEVVAASPEGTLTEGMMCAMTGSRRKVGNNGRCMVSTSEWRTSKSAPLILMRPQCA